MCISRGAFVRVDDCSQTTGVNTQELGSPAEFDAWINEGLRLRILIFLVTYYFKKRIASHVCHIQEYNCHRHSSMYLFTDDLEPNESKLMRGKRRPSIQYAKRTYCSWYSTGTGRLYRYTVNGMRT